jgi:glycosyltransferase involved in cell wall biosynthesis
MAVATLAENRAAAPAPAPAPAPPKAEPPFLTAIFPAYNEEGSIRAVLEEADSSLRGAGFPYEIVVCDDASRDGTRRILEEMAPGMPSLRVLRHPSNRGIQATLEDLYAAARGTWIFHNASDGQWKTAEALRMLPLTGGPRTVVIGRRKEKHYGWWRGFVSAMYNLLPRVLFGVRTYDAGSIKLFPRRLLTDVAPRSPGVFREGERLIRAARTGYRIVPLDVDCAPRRTGTATGARPALVAEAARDLLSCWWRLVVCRER